ncbi:MAG: mannose-1-phosphate guanyltransferase [Planctomycetes bacterium]|nr:mannose-1-phosphate guanyltransferase [Planctomycetota bacterium]
MAIAPRGIDWAVVLAGGSGTRFWPKSRSARPKQFLAFGGSLPLLTETLERTAAVAPAQRTLVITAQAHLALAQAQSPGVPADQLVGEPAARDTAAAIGLAATLVAARDPEARLLVCPADHRIATTAQFATAARAAAALLDEDPARIVVFGIAPTGPATGYGYIERGAALGAREGIACHDVARFHEKPVRARAEEYLASGRFSWNAGIFAFRARTVLDEIARQMPELARGLAEIGAAAGGSGFAATLARVFPTLPRRAFDHGVMEGAPRRALVIPAYAWDDVGSFPAIARARAADADGNVALGQLIVEGARDNIVDAGDGLVALLGVEGLVVVHTPDVTLVCPKERAEEVKALLEKLKQRGSAGDRFT